ncbi:16S rRNA pseudouridine(516) synthase RsuA [Shewanella amazonensis]|uniref:Pseudouridine synthase n=1 Tax=Shewanella amazonensis (strain ATCC BAA-1098 / SB2B) TaxID=326297 RepID=A1S8W0_SHEAM|nr:16S rRNA pseudouridine(516) synthase RsuA [Shewanella amazonensis]ABM00817.1 ribosomal small subunit pseudouridine synthase A [Shewanella amazonensis SB2B]
MRLDKYLAETTALSRGLAKKAINSGDVSCDGVVMKDPAFKVPQGARVCFQGEVLALVGVRYLMLHKPVDTICSTQDEYYPSVLSLLDIARPDKLHIAGRLDADTTGLVLITDDGLWSHKVTSPKRDCAKRYRVQLAESLTDDLIAQFAEGVQLNGEDGLTKPAKLELLSDTEALLSITEGKYHQVKRMFAAVGNKVIGLHREAVGAIELDPQLAPGEWRYLTEAEIASVK